MAKRKTKPFGISLLTAGAVTGALLAAPIAAVAEGPAKTEASGKTAAKAAKAAKTAEKAGAASQKGKSGLQNKAAEKMGVRG